MHERGKRRCRPRLEGCLVSGVSGLLILLVAVVVIFLLRFELAFDDIDQSVAASQEGRLVFADVLCWQQGERLRLFQRLIALSKLLEDGVDVFSLSRARLDWRVCK